MNKMSLLEKAKELNMPRRNCIKTKEELEKAIKDIITKYKKIIFVADSPVCMACLDEVQKQQFIDNKVYDQKLMDDMVTKLAWDELQKNIVMDCYTMLARRTGEMLNLEVDWTYEKNQF